MFASENYRGTWLFIDSRFTLYVQRYVVYCSLLPAM
jgi:hypothetical protein